MRRLSHKSFLLRNIIVWRPNQVWAMDITYIPMARSLMYLAAVVNKLRCSNGGYLAPTGGQLHRIICTPISYLNEFASASIAETPVVACFFLRLLEHAVVTPPTPCRPSRSLNRWESPFLWWSPYLGSYPTSCKTRLRPPMATSMYLPRTCSLL